MVINSQKRMHESYWKFSLSMWHFVEGLSNHPQPQKLPLSALKLRIISQVFFKLVSAFLTISLWTGQKTTSPA